MATSHSATEGNPGSGSSVNRVGKTHAHPPRVTLDRALLDTLDWDARRRARRKRLGLE